MPFDEPAAGGAANVAANIAGLGGIPYLIGIVGDDAEGNLLPDILRGADAWVIIWFVFPIVRRRLRPVSWHLDSMLFSRSGMGDELTADQVETVNRAIYEITGKCRVIVISDSAKGLLTGSML